MWQLNEKSRKIFYDIIGSTENALSKKIRLPDGKDGPTLSEIIKVSLEIKCKGKKRFSEGPNRCPRCGGYLSLFVGGLGIPQICRFADFLRAPAILVVG